MKQVRGCLGCSGLSVMGVAWMFLLMWNLCMGGTDGAGTTKGISVSSLTSRVEMRELLLLPGYEMYNMIFFMLTFWIFFY